MEIEVIYIGKCEGEDFKHRFRVPQGPGRPEHDFMAEVNTPWCKNYIAGKEGQLIKLFVSSDYREILSETPDLQKREDNRIAPTPPGVNFTVKAHCSKCNEETEHVGYVVGTRVK